MAKGPAWSQWEDGVLNAARNANVSYNDVIAVLWGRSPVACRIRANVLRRQAGVIPRPEYNRWCGPWWDKAIERDAQRGSEMLVAAIRLLDSKVGTV